LKLNREFNIESTGFYLNCAEFNGHTSQDSTLKVVSIIRCARAYIGCLLYSLQKVKSLNENFQRSNFAVRFLEKRVKPKSSGYKPPLIRLLPERSNYIFRITTKKKKSISTFIGGEIQVGRKVLLLSTSWLRKYTNKQV
jgi:hypothetical protein